MGEEGRGSAGIIIIIIIIMNDYCVSSNGSKSYECYNNFNQSNAFIWLRNILWSAEAPPEYNLLDEVTLEQVAVHSRKTH